LPSKRWESADNDKKQGNEFWKFLRKLIPEQIPRVSKIANSECKNCFSSRFYAA